MRNTINPKMFMIIIILIGMALLFYSIFTGNKEEGFIETNAIYYSKRSKILTNQENEYVVTYKYNVNGKDYFINDDVISSRKPKYMQNSKVKIKYNPKNPIEAHFSNENPKVTGIIMGIIFIIIGIVGFIKI